MHEADETICRCPCHHPRMGEAVNHIMPCCSECEFCERPVRRGWERQHERMCNPEAKP